MPPIRRFRKRPVVIEAVQWNGMNIAQIYALAGAHTIGLGPDGYPGALEIPTLEGTMRVDRGDWVIRGVQGEIYPCKPDIFAETYEEVADDATVN